MWQDDTHKNLRIGAFGFDPNGWFEFGDNIGVRNFVGYEHIGASTAAESNPFESGFPIYFTALCFYIARLFPAAEIYGTIALMPMEGSNFAVEGLCELRITNRRQDNNHYNRNDQLLEPIQNPCVGRVSH